MAGEYLMAIDAGTGSCRAIVFDAAGRQAAVAQREWTHAPDDGIPGSHVFDTARNWELICACIRECLDRAQLPAGAVAAVSATSMREGMVLYDRAGRELWACPNVDGRAGAEAAELVAEGHADRIYERAGDWVAITAPPRLRWLARHEPELFESVGGLGMLSDWILYRLTGRQVTDPSVGSSSAMFDLATREWSPEILEICGIDPAIVPEVLECGTPMGAVSARAAALTGLPEGTPVVVGGADTQLALVGIGVSEPGSMTVIGGTFWQHTAVLDEALIDPEQRLRTLCHAVPDRWMIEGIGFLSGLTMRWFRDGFCALEAERAREQGIDPYAAMEELAAGAAPGSGGVVGVFSNLMEARHWVHAAPAFVGFDIANPAQSGKGECIRAIEESAAYVSRGHLGIVSELIGREPERVVFTGGAAQGRLWPQILADVLGVPVDVPVVRESTALGAALLAGAGAGLYADAVAAGRDIAAFEATVEPDPERVTTYDELYDAWGGVYRASLEMSEAGLTRPLWRAAGA
jgi:autoinducer 2 (AI-2) kinase